MAQKAELPEKILETARLKFAPDARVSIFDVHFNKETNVLSGKTTDSSAIRYVVKEFGEKGISCENEVRLLPAANLNGLIDGIINVSVANIRSKPAHSAELSTQALLGTVVKIWDYQSGWYQIQTPDHYIGWVDAGGISKVAPQKAASWLKAQKVIYLAPYGFCFSRPDLQSQTISDLVLGVELIQSGESGKFWKVEFPDGRIAYIEKKYAQNYGEWLAGALVSEKTLTATALKMMGIPYLWGGTSTKGMDCSGFTKTVYAAHGWILPRDASQQVYAGEVIKLSGDFSELKPGDLLFFGAANTATSPEKITHVAMWLGNSKFIHASGFIRISSTDPTSPDYDEFNTKRFVRAKRLIGSPNGVTQLSTQKKSR